MKKVIVTMWLILAILSTYSQNDSLQSQKQHIVKPDDIVWQQGPPTLPPGAKYFLIEGHPLKEGPIIMRLLLPAGYIIPAHFHPGAERATVISGTYNMGTGSKFDKQNCKKMPAGSVAVMPAGGIAHYGWASEETIVQVHIDGPLQITYVNPDDDPRIKKNK
jgi:quercetin dioxygenase-like cupin family protein